MYMYYNNNIIGTGCFFSCDFSNIILIVILLTAFGVGHYLFYSSVVARLYILLDYVFVCVCVPGYPVILMTGSMMHYYGVAR